jgi:hypothetical protein
MTNEQLVKLIMLATTKAVKEEFKLMKQELLVEIKRQGSTSRPVDKLTEVQRGFRQQFQVDQKPKKQMSKNPLLNQLLMETEPAPMESKTYLDAFEREDEIINVPTSESGRPINAPKAVIKAMNRDYGHLVQKMDKGSNNQKAKQDFRQQVLSAMNEDSSYEDDEDLSWLDNVK